jgi:non-ribosomal peptide synthetase component F
MPEFAWPGDVHLLEDQPKPYLGPDLSLRPIQIENRSTRFDLTMILFDDQAGVRGYMNYNADLFEPKTVRRMVSHLRKLREGVAAHPDSSISELPMLSPAERAQILVEWNNTQASAARIATVIKSQSRITGATNRPPGENTP